MIKIKLVCVGKIKENYFLDAVKEYEKRLSRYCQFQIKELKEENFNDNPTESDIKTIIKKEGESILKEIKGKAILLDIKGKEYTSVEFSSLIKEETSKEKGRYPPSCVPSLMPLKLTSAIWSTAPK